MYMIETKGGSGLAVTLASQPGHKKVAWTTVTHDEYNSLVRRSTWLAIVHGSYNVVSSVPIEKLY